jgi:hypothetical protein
MGGDDAARSSEKRMRLRYAGRCRVCCTALPAGAQAVYEQLTKTVRCPECVASERPSPLPGTGEGAPEPSCPSTIGTPGASARREYKRRRSRREDRIRTNHPQLGGLILALSGDAQSTRAWEVGAAGEEKLGQRLESLVSPTLRLLHDRRIPGTLANIDHVVVCASGVWVIDAKRYKGRPQLKVEGGIFRPRVERLLVRGRDRSTLVDGVLKQAALVRGAMDGYPPIPVRPVLCFLEADWPLLGGSFATRGVDVIWPRKLTARLGEPGPLGSAAVQDIHIHLAERFPPA